MDNLQKLLERELYVDSLTHRPLFEGLFRPETLDTAYAEYVPDPESPDSVVRAYPEMIGSGLALAKGNALHEQACLAFSTLTLKVHGHREELAYEALREGIALHDAPQEYIPLCLDSLIEACRAVRKYRKHPDGREVRGTELLVGPQLASDIAKWWDYSAARHLPDSLRLRVLPACDDPQFWAIATDFQARRRLIRTPPTVQVRDANKDFVEIKLWGHEAFVVADPRAIWGQKGAKALSDRPG